MGQILSYCWVVEPWQVKLYEDWTGDLREQITKNLSETETKNVRKQKQDELVDNLDPKRVKEILSGKKLSFSYLFPLPTNTLCGIKGLAQKMFILERFLNIFSKIKFKRHSRAMQDNFQVLNPVSFT